MSRSLAYFGSPLIKNAATLAGNLVNASPIGDTLPAFFVLDGEIEIAGDNSPRWIKIEEFYTGYRKTVLKTDEIVTRMRLPIPDDGEIFKIYKVSKRKDLDISSFGAAIFMRMAGPRIEQIRIAFGGVGPMVLRLPRTEAFLSGKISSRELFVEAGNIACGEVTPISDVRGSDSYRRTLAKNILVKFWHDTDSLLPGKPWEFHSESTLLEKIFRTIRPRATSAGNPCSSMMSPRSWASFWPESCHARSRTDG